MSKAPQDPREKLVSALKRAKAAAELDIVSHDKLLRGDFELLRDTGWLYPLYGAYSLLSAEPTRIGDTVHAHLGIGKFLCVYLGKRFATGYSLSPMTSLEYSVKGRMPGSIVVENGEVNQTIPSIAGDYSLIIRKTETDRLEFSEPSGPEGILIQPKEEAIASLNASEMDHNQELLLAALSGSDAGKLSEAFIRKKNQTGAAFASALLSSIGKNPAAERIHDSMQLAGFKLKPVVLKDKERLKVLAREKESSYFIRSKWDQFAKDLQLSLHIPVGLKRQALSELIKKAEDDRFQDSYHSLSIEGYRVTEDLIAKIERGEFDPEKDDQQRSAMAAKGYLEAFRYVIDRARKDEALWKNPADNLGDLDAAVSNLILGIKGRLFAPHAQAGLIPSALRERFRNSPVYIRGSAHVPMNAMKISDAIDGLSLAIRSEKDPFVRATLAHFFIGYIHPFDDGNGRTGRFLMNYLRISSGLPWAIIKVQDRRTYLTALEQASVSGDIKPFVEFISASTGEVLSCYEIKDQKPLFEEPLDTVKREKDQKTENSMVRALCQGINSFPCKNPLGPTHLKGRRKELGICHVCQPKLDT